MRGLKFRFWDGNKIHKVIGLEFFGLDGIKVAKSDGNYSYVGSGFVLMQYTGLRDDNGYDVHTGRRQWRQGKNKRV